MAHIRFRLLRGETNHRAKLPGTAAYRHQQARRQPHQSAVKGTAYLVRNLALSHPTRF